YPQCRALNHTPHPITYSRVVLTVAHIDGDPRNSAPNNLRAWCQRCHLTHDRTATPSTLWNAHHDPSDTPAADTPDRISWLDQRAQATSTPAAPTEGKMSWSKIEDTVEIGDIGARLLANLAKGIYSPDNVLREYVQNAADALVALDDPPDLP